MIATGIQGVSAVAGSSTLQFERPSSVRSGGRRRFVEPLVVERLWRTWQPTVNASRPARQANSLHKRQRLQSRFLRGVDPDTANFGHSHLTDIQKLPAMPAFNIRVATGIATIVGAAQLLHSPDGLVQAKDVWCGHVTKLCVLWRATNSGVRPFWPDHDYSDEVWRPVVGWENFYSVSSYGRVRRTDPRKGARSFGRCRKLTVSNAHVVVSLNRPGAQRVYLVHRLVLEAFIGPAPDGYECCHNDGNGLNNALSNLRWDSARANARDRVRDGATTPLTCRYDDVVCCDPVGSQDMYAITVDAYPAISSAGIVLAANTATRQESLRCARSTQLSVIE